MTGFDLPERYLTWLNRLIGVVLIPYFLAYCVSDAIKLHYAATVVPAAAEYSHNERPRPVGPLPRQFYEVIVHRDIFNLTPAPENVPVADEHLDATLVGTSQVSAGKPYAIIENSGNQAVYRVGDIVPGAGQLLSVNRNRVVILHDGRRVALELPDAGLTPGPALKPVPGQMRRFPRDPHSLARAPVASGVHRIGPNHYVLDRATVDSNLKNMAPLFTEIRATPQLQNGVANGFLLTEIEPNSIFQQLGLQNGDVLQTVNGQGVGDPAKALILLQSLQAQSVITLNVMRNGTPQQVSYRIH
jgi:general secretion pathway protein C